ncbi:hypothetical protein ENTCAN_07949 [Enterobacter cancerogenus ATCC 35316]|nr:hypothetical protein ENTCAN_07949 [Enterobacter cancerogenus ATCC 35316]
MIALVIAYWLDVTFIALLHHRIFIGRFRRGGKWLSGRLTRVKRRMNGKT